MVIKTVELSLVCGVTSKIPAGTLPEFAFAGRSNVGKSTLINGLMNRKSLARVSSQPGKTQTINYYEINRTFHLVDLPGYGYAKANVKVKEQWGRMIERYLRTSRQLRAVFLLLDIRHEPTGQDVMMYDWILEAGFTPVIIATKADKIKKSQLQKQLGLLRRTLRQESHVLAKRKKKAPQQEQNTKLQQDEQPQQETLPQAAGQEKQDIQVTQEPGQAAKEKQAGDQIRIIPWSGQTKSGREEIYAVLDALLAGPEIG
ncbi:MAG: YihA family ribosome biogenesis GTP-binding protein [Lachnospiraceae bacterium]|nr:YihA family ribosome biogenesis GTP-binding protein [Lachnospiraceae bacterium]